MEQPADPGVSMSGRPSLSATGVASVAGVAIGPLEPDRFLSWLGRTAGRAATVAWPVILLPDFVSGAAARAGGAGEAGAALMPDDSVELYQRVEWAGGIPSGVMEARVSLLWARTRGERTEYGLATEMTVEGRPTASSLIVCLTRAPIESFGVPRLPPPPDPGELRAMRQLTIGEDDVREFSSAVRVSYLVTSRTTIAREMGFRNALVPGPMLTATHMAAEPELPDAGSVEVWFRRPITAGSVMELCSGPAMRCMRSIGSAVPATVSRVAPGLEAGGQLQQAQQ